MSLRRPLLLLLLLPVLAGAWACDLGGSGPPIATQGSGSAESERTSEMEDKAAEIERQAEDLRTMEGSDQDKIDAYNKLQQQQQELNSMSEGGEGN